MESLQFKTTGVVEIDIRDVQETVLVLVFFVDAAHECSGGWQDLIDEDEDSLLRGELDALADHVDELTDGEVGWDEVLLLVDGSNIRLFDLFADDLKYTEPVSYRKGAVRGTIRRWMRLQGKLDDTSRASNSKPSSQRVDTYWDPVGVFLANTLGLSLTLLEGVLVLELGTHGGSLIS